MDIRKQYLRHGDINTYLDSLQTNYPKFVSVTTIGHSYEHRPIKAIRISSDLGKVTKFGSAKAIVLIDGGIHAREWCSISTALYCINQLTEHSRQNKILLKNFDFVVVPVVNADGYEYSRTMVG